MTHTYCRAFVTTCFCELGLSRLGFKHPSACEANALVMHINGVHLTVRLHLYNTIIRIGTITNST